MRVLDWNNDHIYRGNNVVIISIRILVRKFFNSNFQASMWISVTEKKEKCIEYFLTISIRDYSHSPLPAVQSMNYFERYESSVNCSYLRQMENQATVVNKPFRYFCNDVSIHEIKLDLWLCNSQIIRYNTDY